MAVPCASLASGVAEAHSFGTPYVLPIPIWIYAYGCAATLIVTFLLLGFLVSGDAVEATGPDGPHCRGRLFGKLDRRIIGLLRLCAGVALVVTFVSSLTGSTDPGRNLGMILFWVIFLLGWAYATLLIGNIYTAINPWKSAVGVLERLGFDLSSCRIALSDGMGSVIACCAYLTLVAIELFFDPAPVTLGLALIGYTLLTLGGVALYGKAAWFDRCDLFEHYFDVFGTLAAARFEKIAGTDHWRMVLRPPLRAAPESHPKHWAALSFILLMLASTTFDGIHATVWWTGLFWTNILAATQTLWGSDIGRAQGLLMGWYLAYQYAGLVLLPMMYLVAYGATLALAKLLTRSTVPLRTLMLRFAHSIIPIAVAYNIAHYLTMLLVQTKGIFCLLADPLGAGSGPESMADCVNAAGLPMTIVWHVQVAVILIGHVAGVWLAHAQAAAMFMLRRQVMVSQLPMLILMMLYTMFGLWVLSLPLGPAIG